MNLFGFLFLLCASLLQVQAFPKDFAWGVATAAYQVEGAWNVSGRGPSIWDVFSHTPGKTAGGDTGDVADEAYYRVSSDLSILRSVLGVSHYRFSVSWPRLFPTGRIESRNQEAFDFYSNLINQLKANNIEPFLTLYHWDLPAALDNSSSSSGWLDPDIADRFAEYASAVFSAYGDRVKYWLTFNEPLTFANQGYLSGVHAPGRCSSRSSCSSGDGSREPYLVAHNVLRAHAKAVQAFRNGKYAGDIGITLNCDWAEPMTDSPDDIAAAQRNLEFQLGWFADPVYFGHYPASLVSLVGARLPSFTVDEQNALKGSSTFFGLNHYTTKYVANVRTPLRKKKRGATAPGDWNSDQLTYVSPINSVTQKPIGVVADSSWLYVVPWGIRKMLNWVADRYSNPPLFITENGVDVPGESSLPLEAALHDGFRVDFYSQYLSNVSAAVTDDGNDVRGYFAWSFMDNYEWADGYSKRFGLVHIDYANNLTRTPKDSAYFYANFIKQSRQAAVEAEA